MNFKKNRQVDLNGEAFFDVSEDKKNPFIVNTNEVNIKVLGTRFNIASYEDEKDVEVVLEEGSLICKIKKNNKSYTMTPNELVVFDKNIDEFSTEIVEPQKYTSWTEGKLIFRNDPFAVVVRKLENWYNIDIEVINDFGRDPRLRATFIDESIEQVLDLLKNSLNIKRIIIRVNK